MCITHAKSSLPPLAPTFIIFKGLSSSSFCSWHFFAASLKVLLTATLKYVMKHVTFNDYDFSFARSCGDDRSRNIFVELHWSNVVCFKRTVMGRLINEWEEIRFWSFFLSLERRLNFCWLWQNLGYQVGSFSYALELIELDQFGRLNVFLWRQLKPIVICSEFWINILPWALFSDTARLMQSTVAKFAYLTIIDACTSEREGETLWFLNANQSSIDRLMFLNKMLKVVVQGERFAIFLA